MILAFNTLADGLPEALIYTANLENAGLEYRILEQGVQVISNQGNPALIVRPSSPGWVVSGQPNVSLTMWVDGPYLGSFGYPGEAPDGQLDARITVGPGEDGLPKWETVELLRDPHPAWGYPRFIAYKRFQNGPDFHTATPIFPGFPYLGFGNHSIDWFSENPNPIYLDLRDATLRVFPFPGFQTGGNYIVNSLSGPPDVNFEAPFGFYDFDPGNRFAELAIRVSHFSPDYFDRAVSYRLNRNDIRYSWKVDDPARWRYALQLAGDRPYKDLIRIGGAEFWGVEPEDLPEWASSYAWPLVTFIEAEAGYPGSEGIYFFNTETDEAWSWLVGKDDQPPVYFNSPLLVEDSTLNQDSSRSLPPGFRGEYIDGNTIQPQLYLSPVDGRLHLLGAEGGTLNLGGGRQLREANIDSDAYLDSWMVESHSLQKVTLEAQLYRFGSILVYAGADEVKVLETDLPQASFELRPPTGRATWQAFRSKMSPYLGQRKDPANLTGWIDSLGKPLFDLDGARVHDVRADGAGYRFVLALQPGFRLAGHDPLGLRERPPGEYLVTLNGGRLAIAPLVPAQVSLALAVQASTGEVPALRVRMANAGTADLAGARLQVVQSCPGQDPAILYEAEKGLLGGETAEVLVSLPAAAPAECSLLAQFTGALGQALAAQAIGSGQLPRPAQPELGALALSSQGGRRLPAFLLLLLSAGLAGLAAFSVYRGRA